MSRYAAETSVPPERTRAEIERVLVRFGADQFLYARDDETQVEVLAFRAQGRQVKFGLPMPQREQYRRTRTGRPRLDDDAISAAVAGAQRERWRALLLGIKAKLVLVEAGITTFEEEFLPHLVLPSGETVGSWMIPQVRLAYESGAMPRLLPAPPGA